MLTTGLVFVATLGLQGSGVQVGTPVKGTLREGKPLTLDFRSTREGRVSVRLDSYDFDTALEVKRVDGKGSWRNFDGGVDTNAHLIFPAAARAQYRIIAKSQTGKGHGEFTLRVDQPAVSRPQGKARYESGIEYRLEAAARARGRGNLTAEHVHHMHRANHLHTLKRYDEAENLRQIVVDFAHRKHEVNLEATTLGSLGSTYLRKGDYEEAIRIYGQSRAVFEGMGDVPRQVWNLGKIAQCYRLMQQPQNVIATLKDRVELVTSHKDASSWASTWDQVIRVRTAQREFQTQVRKDRLGLLRKLTSIDEKFLEVALQQLLSQYKKNDVRGADVLSLLAWTQLKLGKYAQAKASAHEAGLRHPRPTEEAQDLHYEVLASFRLDKRPLPATAMVGDLEPVPLMGRMTNAEFQRLGLVRAEAAVAGFATLGQLYEQARAHFIAGRQRHLLGESEAARDHMMRARALYTREGDERKATSVLPFLIAVVGEGGDLGQAERLAREQLRIWEEFGDERERALARLDLGETLCRRDRSASAIAQFEMALPVLRGSRDETRCLAGLASALGVVGKLDLSLKIYKELLAQCQQMPRTVQAFVRGNLAVLYKLRNDQHAALAECRAALALFREAESWRDIARVLCNLGNLYRTVGMYPQAAECLRESLELVEKHGYAIGIQHACHNLGLLENELGSPEAALKHHRRALEISERLGIRAHKADSMNCVANTLRVLGRFPEAMRMFEQARAVAGAEFPATAAQTWRGAGRIYHDQADYVRARKSFEKALAMFRKIGDEEGIANTLASFGDISNHLNDLVRARMYQREALTKFRKQGNLYQQVWMLSNLSELEFALGDWEESIHLGQLALENGRRLGSFLDEGATLIMLARCWLQVGERARAQRYIEEFQEYASKQKGTDVSADAHGRLGGYYLENGAYDLAREQLEAEFKLRSPGNRDFRACCLMRLAEVYYRLGEFDRAKRKARLALRTKLSLQLEPDALNPLSVLARIALRGGHLSEAKVQLAKAKPWVRRALALDMGIQQRAGLRSHLAVWQQIEQDVAVLTLRRAATKKERSAAIEEGLRAAGQWKQRSLLDGILEHREGGRSAEIIRLRRDIRKTRARHDMALEFVSRAAQQVRPKMDIDSMLTLAHKLGDEVQEKKKVLASLAPEEGTWRESPNLDMSRLRERLCRDDTVVIEYANGESRVFAYVLSSDRFDLVDLGPKTDEGRGVFDVAEAFRETVRGESPRSTARAIARRARTAYDKLLGPVLKNTRGTKRLRIVPCAELADVPFEALATRSTPEAVRGFGEIRFVLDDFEVSYGPSLPVLAELMAARPHEGRGGALVLVDPIYAAAAAVDASTGGFPRRAGAPPRRLEATRKEGLAMTRLLLPGDTEALAAIQSKRSGSIVRSAFRLCFGSDASPAALAGDLRQYRILHFAAHGKVDRTRPMRSRLLLAADAQGRTEFTMAQALDLDLDADLVLLSACDTATGKALAGEGVQSMAMAFMFAGARSVVATLWQVKDEVTSRLVAEFYGEWIREEKSISRALHLAKKSLRESDDPRRAHPHAWAALIHIGAPR